MLAKKFYWHY